VNSASLPTSQHTRSRARGPLEPTQPCLLSHSTRNRRIGPMTSRDLRLASSPVATGLPVTVVRGVRCAYCSSVRVARPGVALTRMRPSLLSSAFVCPVRSWAGAETARERMAGRNVASCVVDVAPASSALLGPRWPFRGLNGHRVVFRPQLSGGSRVRFVGRDGEIWFWAVSGAEI
jgi:hypothetical protein